jgi:S1-C subfamily serine protease
MNNDSIRHRFSILFFLTILALLSPETSHSTPDLPDDNLAYPVLLVSKEGTGSGFFYNKDDATYLITARHVLFQETSIRVPEPFIVPTPLRHKFFLQ